MAEDLASMQAAVEAAEAEPPAETNTEEAVADESVETTETVETTEESTTEEDSESPPTSILSYVDDTYSTKFRDKYKSDEDFLAAIPHLTKKLGERDELAELGKRFKDHEAEFQAWMQSRGQQPPPAAPEANGDQVPEWNPAWRYQITQDAQGNLVPAAGAPTDIVQKYRAYYEWRERRMDEIARNPEKFADHALKGQLEKIREEQKQLLQQEVQQTREHTAIQSWGASVRDKLFISGDPNNGPSQLGQRFQEIYQNDLNGMPDGLAKLQTAYKFAAAEQPKAKPPRKVPAHGKNQPPVSAGPQKTKTAEDYIREGMRMEEALLKEYQQQLAAAD